MADPGFPVGGCGPRTGGGAWTPEAGTFRKFVCQNERIWTLRGRRAPGTSPRSANALQEDTNKDIIIFGLYPGFMCG